MSVSEAVIPMIASPIASKLPTTVTAAAALTANAAVTVASRLDARRDAVIGTTASDTLTVNAAVTANAAVTVAGSLEAKGEAVIGTTASVTLTESMLQ